MKTLTNALVEFIRHATILVKDSAKVLISKGDGNRSCTENLRFERQLRMVVNEQSLLYCFGERTSEVKDDPRLSS